MIVLNEMSFDKVTNREGRWHLRHAVLDSGAHVFVVSAKAPAWTVAVELIPETIEILPDDEGEEVTVSVEDIRALIAWPPEA